MKILLRNFALSCAIVLSQSACEQSGALFNSLFGTEQPVPAITVNKLLGRLNALKAAPMASPGAGMVANEKPVLLVDVRSDTETAVSVIPGAVTRAAYEASADRYTDFTIVPYCTVGARSEAYTRELRKAGVDAVNFSGSILAWVTAGGELQTLSGEATNRVHTYSPRLTVPEGYIQVTE